MRIPLLLFAPLLLMACRHEEAASDVDDAASPPFPLELPAGFAWPGVPAENPLSEASVRLGSALFHEKRLSRDGTIACASCHFASRAFSDTVRMSQGIDGRLGERNAPPLTNLVLHPAFFRDGGVPSLEQQAIAPVHNPLEMDHNITQAAAALRYQEPFATLSMRAYGRPLDAWVLTRALASYQRTLVSGWSRWDRWMQGDASALSEQEVRGWQLFSSQGLNCTACHGGFDFSDHGYHNIGQYLAYADPGRSRITLDPADEGRFKTPTLRNIALTAPYMHDGAMQDLEAVIDHFATGGQPHANRDAAMRAFAITADQRSDLIAFLRALTDERDIDQVP
jgi:cytochrome c peroxidase